MDFTGLDCNGLYWAVPGLFVLDCILFVLGCTGLYWDDRTNFRCLKITCDFKSIKKEVLN